ncbi:MULTISPECIES: PqqD family protein [Streptomyces]|uniref:PqqD family protein n=1 Tax=Streptomyces gilvifuscus TaxID=1550617 RepID=A0ABT5G8F7_9ACTN|nr:MULTISPECIES: PqqD family protein [Streptomyces]MBK3643153.1 PqqD family protein [Streptomyces sp. MBT33]MDC2961100.1 PqqD family protein [Streptomyces gilvifuscus]
MTDAPAIAPGDVPRRVLGIRVRRSGEDLLLGWADQALRLDGSAALVYASVDGTRGVGDVARVLVEQYGIDEEEALADVTEFLADLTARNVIEW